MSCLAGHFSDALKDSVLKPSITHRMFVESSILFDVLARSFPSFAISAWQEASESRTPACPAAAKPHVKPTTGRFSIPQEGLRARVAFDLRWWDGASARAWSQPVRNQQLGEVRSLAPCSGCRHGADACGAEEITAAPPTWLDASDLNPTLGLAAGTVMAILHRPHRPCDT